MRLRTRSLSRGRREYLRGRGRVLIRARARLVGIGRGRVWFCSSFWPLSGWLWAVLAVAGGLEAVPPALCSAGCAACGPWLLCWLWPVVGGAGCAYGLEAVPLAGGAVRPCGWRLCGCAVICWPPACWLCALPGGRAPAGRPAVPYGLEAVPLAGYAAGGLEAGRHRGRRSCPPPVPWRGGPPVLCFWLAACLPVC